MTDGTSEKFVVYRNELCHKKLHKHSREPPKIYCRASRTSDTYLPVHNDRPVKVSESTAQYYASFREELRRSIVEAMSPRIIATYATAVVICIALSVSLPYQTQVYLSIGAGITVALLLPLSMVLSRGFASVDIIFVSGILFLLIALLRSDLPTRAVLENVRHFSLIVSVGLAGTYLALQLLQGRRIKSHAMSVKGFSNFFSVCSTTLSSELCSCLHPVLFLEALGIVAFLPNQVRIGFVIMMTTLFHQARLTYESYRSRERRRT